MSRGLTILLLLSLAPAPPRASDGVPLKRIQSTHVAREKQEVPQDIAKLSASSPLHCYVAAELLWNPLLDTSRLIRKGTGVLE